MPAGNNFPAGKSIAFRVPYLSSRTRSSTRSSRRSCRRAAPPPRGRGRPSRPSESFGRVAKSESTVRFAPSESPVRAAHPSRPSESPCAARASRREAAGGGPFPRPVALPAEPCVRVARPSRRVRVTPRPRVRVARPSRVTDPCPFGLVRVTPGRSPPSTPPRTTPSLLPSLPLLPSLFPSLPRRSLGPQTGARTRNRPGARARPRFKAADSWHRLYYCY